MEKLSKLILAIIITGFSSCAHQSGRYVMKNGKWTFQRSSVGFMNERYGKSRVDDSAYDFKDNGRFLWPVPGSKRVSSKFGKRGHRHHDGIDIAAVSGTHIIASDKGEIVAATKMRGYGNIIIVKHAGGYHTVYAHNKKHFVKKGQKVSRGEVIGQVGSTGRSTGPHLHFEVRRNNKVRNPAMYLVKK